jgi:tRNA(adenine34) deaminase
MITQTWFRGPRCVGQSVHMPDARPDDWVALSTQWREAFVLAWEAFQAGSPAVGAVVVGPDGSILGRGRSRRGEATAPQGQIAGSRLAHAELNALASLSVDVEPGTVVYTTLQPCFLCSAAAAMSRVATVWFAGRDPVWRFVHGIGDADPILRERWYELRGPLIGPVGSWASLLPLVDRLERNPTGLRLDAFEADTPDLVQFARELVAAGRVGQLRRMTLDEAVADVWTELTALAGGAEGPV